MRKYLLLRMRARFWADNGWLNTGDRWYLRQLFREVLFNRAE